MGNTLFGDLQDRPWSQRNRLNETFSCTACAQTLRHFQLFVTPKAVVNQAPLSMGFFWQEYWNGVPLRPPGNVPGPEIEPESLTSPAMIGRFLSSGATWEDLAPLRSSFFNLSGFQLLNFIFLGFRFFISKIKIQKNLDNRVMMGKSLR